MIILNPNSDNFVLYLYLKFKKVTSIRKSNKNNISLVYLFFPLTMMSKSLKIQTGSWALKSKTKTQKDICCLFLVSKLNSLTKPFFFFFFFYVIYTFHWFIHWILIDFEETKSVRIWCRKQKPGKIRSYPIFSHYLVLACKTVGN